MKDRERKNWRAKKREERREREERKGRLVEMPVVATKGPRRPPEICLALSEEKKRERGEREIDGQRKR